jgi:hypothetical protein
MTFWADLDECRTLAELRDHAEALAEAGGEAERIGCEVRFADEDIGDRQVEVRGAARQIPAAVTAFGDRGFDPVVYAEDAAERAFLEARLPEGVELA